MRLFAHQPAFPKPAEVPVRKLLLCAKCISQRLSKTLLLTSKRSSAKRRRWEQTTVCSEVKGARQLNTELQPRRKSQLQAGLSPSVFFGIVLANSASLWLIISSSNTDGCAGQRQRREAAVQEQ